MKTKSSIREAKGRAFERRAGDPGHVIGLVLALLALAWLGSPLAWRSGDPPHAFLIMSLLAGLLAVEYVVNRGLPVPWPGRHLALIGLVLAMILWVKRQGLPDWVGPVLLGWVSVDYWDWSRRAKSAPFLPVCGMAKSILGAILVGMLLLASASFALGLGYAPRWISFTYGNLFLGHSHAEVLQTAVSAFLRALFMALIGEELVFRGILLTALQRAGLGPARAVLGQGLLFAIYVLGKGQGGLSERYPGAVEAGLLGASLGLLFLKTGSVWACALARAGYDAYNRKIVSDVSSPVDGIFHYVVADPHWFWVKAGILIVPLIILLLVWSRALTQTGARAVGKGVLAGARDDLAPSPAFAGALAVLAAWTLSIKFAVPIQMAVAESQPWKTYVLWDFWWILHLNLALALAWRWPRTWLPAVIISVVEIAIVLIKLNAYLLQPYGGIWRAHWFYNKLVVLLLFSLLLTWLFRPGVKESLQTAHARSRDA